MSIRDEADRAQPAAGISGTLKLLAAVTVVVLAVLGTLFVFDVIPLATLSDVSARVGLMAGIVAVAAGVVWVLARNSRR